MKTGIIALSILLALSTLGLNYQYNAIKNKDLELADVKAANVLILKEKDSILKATERELFDLEKDAKEFLCKDAIKIKATGDNPFPYLYKNSPCF